MTQINPDYSVVVPVFNSHESLEELFSRIRTTLTGAGYSFEVIFVDDDSLDESWRVLESLKQIHPADITAIRLARNYGQHNATLCGIAQASGNFVFTIDDDLQNPPEEMLKLIEGMKALDADLVYGVYGEKHHSLMRNIGSGAVKGWSKRLFKNKGDGSSFRLMKATLAKKLLNHRINFIYIDELFNWYTSHIAFVLTEHRKRPYQKSTYTSHSLFSLFSNLVIYYTSIPLRGMVYGGFISSLFSFIIGVIFIYRKIIHDVPLGFTALIVAVLFSTSIIILSLGIIGEYISRIYMVQNQKPPYVIKTSLSHETV